MTSSFSSFPASFSTFPDLEVGSSKKSDEPPDKDRKSEKSKSKAKSEKRDRNRSRDRDREKRNGRDRAGERDRKVKGVERERSKDEIRGREDNGKRERHKDRKLKQKQRDKDKHAKSSHHDDAGAREQAFSADLIRHEQSYRLYFSDTKGDPLTLQYGGLYAGDIPKYHLHSGKFPLRSIVTSNDSQGGRQILGLSKAWAVFRRAGKGIEVGLKGTRKVG
jgi:hypothetical protein